MRGLFRVFRALLVGLVFSLTGFCFSVTAVAKTIEIKSENFVFVGNVREKDGKALILELEQYRQAILQIVGIKDIKPEIVPVRIYAVKSSKELKLLTGRTDIAGVYKSTIDGPVFILNAKSGFKRGKRARYIALHEFTHHLLATYTRDRYPLWFNEGLADYYATFEVTKDGNLVIGRPYNPYGYPLSQQVWIPTNVIVNSVNNYPFQSTGRRARGMSTPDFFYAQSWLAVHYIKTNKQESAKMINYIGLLNGGKRSVPAFTQAFGQTPEQYHDVLRRYFRANKFSTITVKPNIDVREHDFTVRGVEKDEALFHLAEAMRFFSSQNVKTAKIEAQYDKAAKLLGETPLILAARADLASWENDYVRATDYLNKALAVAPDNAAVLKTAGIVLAYKNQEPESSDLAELKLAQKYLKHVLARNPNDKGAKHYLGKVEFTLSIR
ncbi:MAG: hypothetical protein L3J65_01190 [Robiginitomaculum sp.]|nr:hypothetical protein [Robiginitomaculum sp.]